MAEISSERQRSREEPSQPVAFRKGFLEEATLNGKWREARSGVIQAEGGPCAKVQRWVRAQRTRDRRRMGRRMCREKLQMSWELWTGVRPQEAERC